MSAFAEGRDFAGGDIVGDRKGQEDFHAFLLLDGGAELLSVMADGMGGHEAGEVASRLAVESFARSFQRHGAASITVRLGAALQAADNALAAHIAAHPELAGMGCTLVAAHVSPQGLYWISVGDSPLYLLRKGKLTQINEDHSMAPEIEKSLKAGKISAEEARNHPHRNALRSAVMGEGFSKLVDSPTKPLPLLAGDVIVLASDGVQTLTEPEIGSLLTANASLPLQENVARLLRAVQKKQRRNQDNTTVQLVRVPGQVAATRLPRNWLLPGLAGLVILLLAGLATYALQTKLGFKPSQLIQDTLGSDDPDAGKGNSAASENEDRPTPRPQEQAEPQGDRPPARAPERAPEAEAQSDAPKETPPADRAPPKPDAQRTEPPVDRSAPAPAKPKETPPSGH